MKFPGVGDSHILPHTDFENEDIPRSILFQTALKTLVFIHIDSCLVRCFMALGGHLSSTWRQEIVPELFIYVALSVWSFIMGES